MQPAGTTRRRVTCSEITTARSCGRSRASLPDHAHVLGNQVARAKAPILAKKVPPPPLLVFQHQVRSAAVAEFEGGFEVEALLGAHFSNGSILLDIHDRVALTLWPV